MVALDNTFGVMLIGIVVAAVLYGVTCVQTWYYFDRYHSDPWYTKLLVCAVFASDSIHQGLITHTVYKYLITDFGVSSALSKVEWSIFVALLFDGFTTVMVQCFLTLRIYKLSNKSHIAPTAILVFLIIAGFVVVLVTTIKGLHYADFSQLGDLHELSMGFNAITAVADVLIAIFLCKLLRQARTGFKRTNGMIKKMMMFSINTGLLTSICAMMSLISIITWPNAFIYIVFYFCIGRLYCNSLLATLNARKDILGDSYDENNISLQIQKSTTSPVSGMQKQNTNPNPNTISIKIETKKEYLVDEESLSPPPSPSPPSGNLKVDHQHQHQVD